MTWCCRQLRTNSKLSPPQDAGLSCSLPRRPWFSLIHDSLYGTRIDLTICSMVMLNKTFTSKQWIALLVLSIGVSICQYKPSESSQHVQGEDKVRHFDSPVSTGPELSAHMCQVSGMLALIAACFTSSIAGCLISSAVCWSLMLTVFLPVCTLRRCSSKAR